MPTWTVLTTPVPADLDAPEAWAVHGEAAVCRAVQLDQRGHDDLARTARQILAELWPQTYSRAVRVVATTDAAEPTAQDVLGYASVTLPLTGNPDLAHLDVGVRPEDQGRSLGTALLAEAERIAADAGRTVVVLRTGQVGEPAPDDPDALLAPTGSGRVRASDPGVRLARARGYVLEQAERYSMLELPMNPPLLQALHGDAVRRAGEDYRLHTWVGDLPEEHLDRFAVLRTRMSTDPPMAGLAIQADGWDAARVRAEEAKAHRSGHAALTTAVEHVPSGELVGCSGIDFALDRPQPAFQGDTVVLRAHHGRRLAMLLTTRQLLRLPEARPGAARLHTWSTEESGRLLEINSTLGFRPTGVTGVWQKRT